MSRGTSFLRYTEAAPINDRKTTLPEMSMNFYAGSGMADGRESRRCRGQFSSGMFTLGFSSSPPGVTV